jgi:hypothetical protein
MHLQTSNCHIICQDSKDQELEKILAGAATAVT